MDNFDFTNRADAQTARIATGGGPLSEYEQKTIVEQIQSVFTESAHDVSEFAEHDGEEDVGSEHALHVLHVKTEGLRKAFEGLGMLWIARSRHMEAATEKMADGSRDPKWRRSIGDAGILNFYLEILKTETVPFPLKVQIMRLVGNTCADTDENRARLVASNALPQIIAQLYDTSSLPFAIPVLYNICIDYEPAQKQASENTLTSALVDLISGPNFVDAVAFTGYICKLMDLMAIQDPEKTMVPTHTAYVLIKIAPAHPAITDLEDFISVVTTAINYLGTERLQQGLLDLGGLEPALEILTQSYSRFDLQVLDNDDTTALNQIRLSLNQVLADVSALPSFYEVASSPPSRAIVTLRSWLFRPHLQLQICACIILGNIARSDSVCEEMVQVMQIHKQLISIITSANDSQLLHSAVGFLKNLALPVSNKAIIVEAGVFDVLPRLWNMDVLQQVQFSAVSLARQLVQNTFISVSMLGRGLSTDVYSPSSSKTRLSILIDLFDRTDIEPVKMEISRLIAAMCRVYNSISDPAAHGVTEDKIVRRRVCFFERHSDIGRPLAFMVSQTKWPVVRSEGWFVFALMARYPEGADCISNVMNDTGVFQVLVELMTGQGVAEYSSSPSSRAGSQVRSPESGGDSSSRENNPFLPSSNTASLDGLVPLAQAPGTSGKATDLQRIDRMNALVLLTELLKNKGDKMAVMKRATFEDLIQKGGGIVSGYSEEERTGGEDGKTRPIPIEQATKDTQLGDLARQSIADLM